MMNPEDNAGANSKPAKQEEKSSDENDLSASEFSFQPRLEMMKDTEISNQVTVDLNDEGSGGKKTSSDNTREPLQYSQPVTLNQYIYPGANHIGTKSNASVTVKQNMIRKFYAMRPGAFEHAVEDVKQYLNPVIEGKFLSAWLMAEVDHWDHEKERIVIITDTQVVLIKYNFVATRIDECRRIQLHRIDRIQGGRFTYPEKTMMMPRAFQTGIRFSWNKNEVLTRWQRFSPFFNSPSYMTFTQHKAAFYMDTLPAHMVYEDFKAALINATQGSGAMFEVVVEPIFIEVYIGAMSVVHNSSDMGYSKDRGAASF